MITVGVELDELSDASEVMAKTEETNTGPLDEVAVAWELVVVISPRLLDPILETEELAV